MSTERRASVRHQRTVLALLAIALVVVTLLALLTSTLAHAHAAPPAVAGTPDAALLPAARAGMAAALTVEETQTATPTPTGTQPTHTATPTQDPAQPTWTPTPTATPTYDPAQPTPTPTITVTPLPTATYDPAQPTWTPTPTATPTYYPAQPTPTPTPTATGAVTPPPATETVIPPDTGGMLTGPVGDQQASLAVPPGAVSEPITLTMQTVTEPPAAGGFAALGQGFRIEAQTQAGAPVTQFAQPLTLVVHYSDADVAGIDENTLQIFYWNEAQAAWVAIPTTVDAATNTLTAQLDHLTLFAVLGTPARQPGVYLPLVYR